jgi:hypothetical protein
VLLFVEGKIDEDVYERWNRAAGDKKRRKSKRHS